MNEREAGRDLVSVEHYTDAERADRERELLEDNGLHPILREETRDGYDGPVFVLEVPENELETANDILEEYWESEEDETLEIFEEWEEESDEVRENFEQD